MLSIMEEEYQSIRMRKIVLSLITALYIRISLIMEEECIMVILSFITALYITILFRKSKEEEEEECTFTQRMVILNSMKILYTTMQFSIVEEEEH